MTWRVLVLSQVLNTDALQNSGDGVIDARQGLFDGAAGGEVTGFRTLGARGDKKRPVDGQDDFVSRDGSRIFRKRIPTVHARMRFQQSGLGELLQDLREQLSRDPVGIGDVLRAEGDGFGYNQVFRSSFARGRVGSFGEKLQRHQSVIGFFRQLEHGISDCFGPCLVYDRSGPGFKGWLQDENGRQIRVFSAFWRLNLRERPLQSAERASYFN